MKIALITGSYPPEACGVGDYTYRLSSALQEKGVMVETVHNFHWNIGDAFKISRYIKSLKPDVIHIQYPTIGYGKGLAPQLVSLQLPTIVTLHEFSRAHILRQLSLYPFTLRTNKLIFTSLYECDYAKKVAPWISNRTSIIPIGSNIPVYTDNESIEAGNIVYFGIISRNKGIEEVIELAKLIKNKGLKFKINIIGMPNKLQLDYLAHLQSLTVGLPVVWNLGLEESKVAKLLSKAWVAYLPFPDGVSERRGSLLAVLSNGLPVITTKGSHTTSDLSNTVIFTSSAEDTLEEIKQLAHNEQKHVLYAVKGREYAKKFSWSEIASKHIEIYQQYSKK